MNDYDNRLMDFLHDRPSTVPEISAGTGITCPIAYYHLSRLVIEGLVLSVERNSRIIYILARTKRTVRR